ncbi:unnamed protein product [Cercopithifilaria johnstoni]|uniref:Uncharacterized protein n=1 Tax=Cercopithifilaria johnstoni TaxID=2874296 RepID=A0A8J2Q736_9BILA|nr:unnamed protein product [Cercopithifilaria johnstoni]
MDNTKEDIATFSGTGILVHESKNMKQLPPNLPCHRIIWTPGFQLLTESCCPICNGRHVTPNATWPITCVCATQASQLRQLPGAGSILTKTPLLP